jgi:deoxyadenosine/deoxycytidine kinase
MSANSSRPLIISIEGNIGVGKSTILNELKNQFRTNNINAVFMQEPVGLWENVVDENGNTMLSKYYANSEKYAFPFQIMAYTTRLSTLRNCIESNPGCDVIVCERSLEADKNIFAKMLFDDKMIESVNYQIYNMLYADTADKYAVDGVVYLRAEPAKCLERVQTRMREGESSISLEYLTQCHHYYDAWLYEDRPSCFMMDLDTNYEAEYSNPEGAGQDWVQSIIDFITICVENKQNECVTEKHYNVR